MLYVAVNAMSDEYFCWASMKMHLAVKPWGRDFLRKC